MSVSKRVMSKVSLEVSEQQAATISFGERFQASSQFDQVFKEGMALVERTASYLDGEGRKESKGLTGQATVLYATESMRLTTRLLDLASWLLIRRGLKDGEITEQEAERKRARVKLQAIGRPSHIRGFDDLPSGLRELITSSFALHDRIVQLDRAMNPKPSETEDAPIANPVGVQFKKLELAFSRPN